MMPGLLDTLDFLPSLDRPESSVGTNRKKTPKIPLTSNLGFAIITGNVTGNVCAEGGASSANQDTPQ